MRSHRHTLTFRHRCWMCIERKDEMRAPGIWACAYLHCETKRNGTHSPNHSFHSTFFHFFWWKKREKNGWSEHDFERYSSTSLLRSVIIGSLTQKCVLICVVCGVDVLWHYYNDFVPGESSAINTIRFTLSVPAWWLWIFSLHYCLVHTNSSKDLDKQKSKSYFETNATLHYK